MTAQLACARALCEPEPNAETIIRLPWRALYWQISVGAGCLKVGMRLR